MMPLKTDLGPTPTLPLTEAAIRAAVLQAMRTTNLARHADDQLVVSENAALYGPDSRLDSLGLVALLLDVEEAVADLGCPVVLSDERAMSQKRSPFRSVPSLVGYIVELARA